MSIQLFFGDQMSYLQRQSWNLLKRDMKKPYSITFIYQVTKYSLKLSHEEKVIENTEYP
jgi:hypothetical protein